MAPLSFFITLEILNIFKTTSAPKPKVAYQWRQCHVAWNEPSRHLLVQSQQWKHSNSVLNLFRFKNKYPERFPGKCYQQFVNL